MSSSISNSEFTIQLENMINDFIKEKIELIMKQELTNFIQVERPDLEDSKNGYYQRSLDTKYGRIKNLQFHVIAWVNFKRKSLSHISD